MLANEVLERFAQGSPVTVMAQLGLMHALDAQWLDTLFDREAESQYTRDLLFSTTVELMSLVALGLRPSVHAAAKRMPELPVSVQALYEKLKKTEPAVVRALVRGSADRLTPVLQALGGFAPPMVPGYRVRIVDGNHLPASEKRLKPLRARCGAALPGHALVVYDPDLQVVVDLVPWEDAYTQERLVMQTLLRTAAAGELWLGDRNFCTRAILLGLLQQGAHFLIREHAANAHPEVLGPATARGVTDTGTVFEQPVCLVDDQGTPHHLRRIELHLTTPTEAGESVIRLLSNVPATALTAGQLAPVYRNRWGIEHVFQRLESVLHSEVRTLGHPRAALLAFGVAVLAYNILALVQRAVHQQHAPFLAEQQMALSSYYVAGEIKAQYAGMRTAVPDRVWHRYASLRASQLAALLLVLAAQVDPRQFRSHPRGPKKPKPQHGRPLRATERHFSTARVLAAERLQS
jgi:IS4 transposase